MEEIRYDGKITCSDKKLLKWVLEMLENKGVQYVQSWDGDVNHFVEIYKKVQ